MDSRCASERNVSFCNRPHPERLSPPDRRDLRPWQPFVGEGMSSRDLNNEGYFSNHRKRLPSPVPGSGTTCWTSWKFLLRNVKGSTCGTSQMRRDSTAFFFRALTPIKPFAGPPGHLDPAGVWACSNDGEVLCHAHQVPVHGEIIAFSRNIWADVQASNFLDRSCSVFVSRSRCSRYPVQEGTIISTR